MPHKNRVTPYGEIVVSPLRCAWMGNRGCLHEGYDIVRPWNGKRWITCALEFRGWVAPKWDPGRWTALFFHDEAVALAAGHRPCALCRRADYVRYCDALGMKGADAIDARLHGDRLDGRRKRLHTLLWSEVPAGVFVETGDGPALVAGDGLRSWTAEAGYGPTFDRPIGGRATVITPLTNVLAVRAGYESRQDSA
ncbi:MAG: hypothetical protein QOD92_2137 [Acidimicrobiaceae bacterium]|jgi:hypothetical protein